MDSVAKLPAKEREALFNESGASRGLANAIIEKDFWVCWTLKRLFALQRPNDPKLVFKGGTSLSKAYDAIRRFSEDIDLSFDRAALGYVGERDPEQATSNVAKTLIKDLAADVQSHIANDAMPALAVAIAAELGEPTTNGWQLEIDPDDPQTLNFQYPSSLGKGSYDDVTYIRPRVRMEFGARGDPWPVERRSIVPYAAEDFPGLFASASVEVDVLSARRTFWEKATLLHAEFHRPADSATPQYYSRHYYDLASLADTEWGREAAADFELLAQVVHHKSVFFRSGWAKYDEAKAGSLRLTPNSARIADLRKDYREMAPMMFYYPPVNFDKIITRLAALEQQINSI